MTVVSSFTIKPLVLGCLCGLALVTSACGNDRGVPTSPSGSAAPASLRETPQGTLPAGSQGQLPFHGSLEATETETGSFPVLTVHLTGTGEATHLGEFTATFDFRLDLRTATGVGTFILTAANGDSVSGSLTGHASIASGVVSITETAAITGGTGRFAGATGSFVTTRSLVQATGMSSGTFEGTIDLHN